MSHAVAGGSEVLANLFGLLTGFALLGSFVRAPDLKVISSPLRGTAFLLSLMPSASLMPVDRLPAAAAGTVGHP